MSDSAPLSLSVSVERWPIAGSFTIARGSKTEAVVVVATLSDGTHTGRGECVPYARYGESVDEIAAILNGLNENVARGMTREDVQTQLSPGAARNALDCAFWDLEAKQSGRRVWELAGTIAPEKTTTAFTLSLASADTMHENARKASARPLLKVKLGGETKADMERLKAVRSGAPNSQLIIDANEGWSVAEFPKLMQACVEADVTLIEQPLPAGDDGALADLERLVPVCADESAHDSKGLAHLIGLYDAINIKLDKTGGLTEALELKAQANMAGLKIMVGCMLATSLAMAPALIIAADADIVDLDGPLLLAQDRDPGLVFNGSEIEDLPASVWG